MEINMKLNDSSTMRKTKVFYLESEDETFLSVIGIHSDLMIEHYQEVQSQTTNENTFLYLNGNN